MCYTTYDDLICTTNDVQRINNLIWLTCYEVYHCLVFDILLRKRHFLTHTTAIFNVAELAKNHRASTMYGDGLAAVWSRNDTPLFQMGEGTHLLIHASGAKAVPVDFWTRRCFKGID